MVVLAKLETDSSLTFHIPSDFKCASFCVHFQMLLVFFLGFSVNAELRQPVSNRAGLNVVSQRDIVDMVTYATAWICFHYRDLYQMANKIECAKPPLAFTYDIM